MFYLFIYLVVYFENTWILSSVFHKKEKHPNMFQVTAAFSI